MLAKLVFFLHVLDGVIISSWLTLAIPGSFLASPAVNTVRWGYWLSPGLVWKIPQEGMHMGRPHSHVLTQDRSRMFLLGSLPACCPWKKPGMFTRILHCWDWSSCRKDGFFHLPAEDNRAASFMQGKPYAMGSNSCPNPAGGGAHEKGGAVRFTWMLILLSMFIEHGPWARTVLISGDTQTECHGLCSQAVYIIKREQRK